MDTLHPIAHIKTDFPDKFGIPRQSGLVKELRATIVFTPDYRIPEALRGLEDFSHLWLIWGFSEHKSWSPTVRPPRLGGSVRMGVFATRSPFRPNPLGLSCVKLEGLALTPQEGTVIHVSGADLMDGSPIYDIKPYIPYVDCHPEATGGFAPNAPEELLEVSIPDHLLSTIAPEDAVVIRQLLALDPRPPYQNDPERIYGMAFRDLDIRFTVDGLQLSVIEILKRPTFI